MNNTHSWPLNAWYTVAWSKEIGHELSARRICDQDVVLYRRETGEVVALEDSCPHRMLPLSMGRLDGDHVVCGYHGLTLDATGRCVRMPAQETINPSLCTRAYAVVERDRLVWLWMGSPALADPQKIPDFHWNDDARLEGEGGTFYSLRCNYRLVVDNLMDLTHETFVHAGSIGHDAITKTPFEVTHSDNEVRVTRWMTNIEAPPFWAKQLGAQGPVDRWQIVHFQPPCTVVGDVGVAETGSGAVQGDRSKGVTGYFLGTITPETEQSCHYFWNFVRDHHLGDENLTRELNKAHANGGNGVYEQDVTVLEAQQRAMERHDRRPFYNLNIDAGALWSRRLIDRMLAAEREQNEPHAPRAVGRSQ